MVNVIVTGCTCPSGVLTVISPTLAPAGIPLGLTETEKSVEETEVTLTQAGYAATVKGPVPDFTEKVCAATAVALDQTAENVSVAVDSVSGTAAVPSWVMA